MKEPISEIEILEENTPVCESENSFLDPVNIENQNEEIEIQEIKKINIADMKNAIYTLRNGFMQHDPAGLFELHPVMDRISSLVNKTYHQKHITEYFKNV